MREIPDCSKCKLKCHGCKGFNTCLMRREEDGWRVTDCKLMASKYYLYEKYLDSYTMGLCKYQDSCRSAFDAWR